MRKIIIILILSLFFLTTQNFEDFSINLFEEDFEQITESFDFNNITEKVEENLSKLNENLNDYHSSTQEDKNINLEKVELLYAIDGDTLFVAASDGINKKVRLIGIDCPESVHSDETQNTEFGKMASDYTTALLEPYKKCRKRVIIKNWIEELSADKYAYELYPDSELFNQCMIYKSKMEKRDHSSYSHPSWKIRCSFIANNIPVTYENVEKEFVLWKGKKYENL